MDALGGKTESTQTRFDAPASNSMEWLDRI